MHTKCKITCKRSESARERRTALYKSDQQQNNSKQSESSSKPWVSSATSSTLQKTHCAADSLTENPFWCPMAQAGRADREAELQSWETAGTLHATALRSTTGTDKLPWEWDPHRVMWNRSPEAFLAITLAMCWLTLWRTRNQDRKSAMTHVDSKTRNWDCKVYWPCVDCRCEGPEIRTVIVQWHMLIKRPETGIVKCHGLGWPKDQRSGLRNSNNMYVG